MFFNRMDVEKAERVAFPHFETVQNSLSKILNASKGPLLMPPQFFDILQHKGC